jgi:hypothetical protein
LLLFLHADSNIDFGTMTSRKRQSSEVCESGRGSEDMFRLPDEDWLAREATDSPSRNFSAVNSHAAYDQ